MNHRTHIINIISILKYTIFLAFLPFFFISTAYAQPVGTNPGIVNIEEEDGSPSVYPWKLKVSNTTLTDNNDGTASLTTGGGGAGTPGGSSTQFQYNNAGSFGGVLNAVTDGTTLTATSPIIETTLTFQQSNGTDIATWAVGGFLFSSPVSITSQLTLTGYNCSTNANGGVLSANSSGIVYCQDDDSGGWTDNGTEVNLNTSTDDVEIGSASTLSAKVAINGDSDEIQMLVQSNGTQTTDPFVVENSSGTDLFNVQNDGSAVVTGDGSQSTIAEGLVVNNADGTDTDDDFKVNGSQDMYFKTSNGRLGLGTATPSEILDVVGNIKSTGSIVSTSTGSIGWSVVDQTDNQACTTGCTNACVFGIANATGTAVTNLVDCSDTTSDLCVCSGSN